MQETDKIKSNITRLAYYQIVGGAIGVIYLIWLIATTFPVQGLSVLVFLLMAIFFALSVCSGWLLLEKQTDVGLTLSKINQILQIFGVAFGGFGYEYVAGIMMSPSIDLQDGFHITLSASISKFEFFFNSSRDAAKVEINLVAIYLLFFTGKLQNAIAAQKKMGISEEEH